MKKTTKIINYFIIGVFISYTITVAISLIIGDGNFYPVSEVLLERFENEITAVLAQTILSGVYGIACGVLYKIWLLSKWSLTKRTIVHLICLSLAIFPIGYLAGWFNYNIWVFISFITIFLFIYIIIWVSIFLYEKQQIKKINSALKK